VRDGIGAHCRILPRSWANITVKSSRSRNVASPLRTELGDCFDHHGTAAAEKAPSMSISASMNAIQEASPSKRFKLTRRSIRGVRLYDSIGSQNARNERPRKDHCLSPGSAPLSN
jgi:hypothetical protein